MTERKREGKTCNTSDKGRVRGERERVTMTERQREREREATGVAKEERGEGEKDQTVYSRSKKAGSSTLAAPRVMHARSRMAEAATQPQPPFW